MSVKIDRLKCTGCGACTTFCPVGALYVDENEMKCIVSVDCIDCGECIPRCSFKAITPAEENRKD